MCNARPIVAIAHASPEARKRAPELRDIKALDVSEELRTCFVLVEYWRRVEGGQRKSCGMCRIAVAGAQGQGVIVKVNHDRRRK